MRKSSLFNVDRFGLLGRAAMLALLAACLTGCPDAEALDRQQVADELDQALKLYQSAEQGYDAKQNDEELRKIRYAKLEEAQKVLDAIRAGNKGSDAQKASTLQLLADVHEAFARFHHDQALSNWAGLANGEKQLLNVFTAADRAQTLGETSSFQDEAALQSFKDRLRTAQAEAQQMHADAQAMEQQVAQRQQQISALAAERDELTAQAMKLNQQGFVSAGQEKLALMDQASEAQVAADNRDAQIQTLQLEIDTRTSERTVLQTRQDAKDAEIELLATRVSELENRRNEASQLVDRMSEDAAEYQRSVLLQLEKMTEAYKTQVDDEFDIALEHADKAVEALENAKRHARAQVRNDISMMMAQKQLSKINILADRKEVHEKHGSILTVVHANAPRVMPNHVPAVQAALEASQKQMSDLVSQTATAIVRGEEIVNDVNQPEQVQPQAQLLSNFRARLGDAAIIAPVSNNTPGATPDATANPVNNAPAAALNSSMPPLPDLAYSDMFPGLVILDGSVFSPDEIIATATTIGGDAAAKMVNDQFGDFRANYDALDQAGAMAVVVGEPVPATIEDEAMSTIFIAASEGESLDLPEVTRVVETAFPINDSYNATPIAGTRWTMFHPATQPTPALPNPERRRLVNEALAAMANQSVKVLIVPNDEARQRVRELTADEPDPLREQIMENGLWMAVGVRVGDAPMITILTRMNSVAEANALKSTADEMIAPSSQVGQLLAAAPGAVDVQAQNDRVQLTIDGLKFKPVIQAFMMMAALSGGEGNSDTTGESAPPPAPDFDF